MVRRSGSVQAQVDCASAPPTRTASPGDCQVVVGAVLAGLVAALPSPQALAQQVPDAGSLLRQQAPEPARPRPAAPGPEAPTPAVPAAASRTQEFSLEVKCQ